MNNVPFPKQAAWQEARGWSRPLTALEPGQLSEPHPAQALRGQRTNPPRDVPPEASGPWRAAAHMHRSVEHRPAPLGAVTLLGAGNMAGLGTVGGKCDLYLTIQTCILGRSVILRGCLISLGLCFPHLSNGLIVVLDSSLLRSPLRAGEPTFQHCDATVVALLSAFRA